jgi:hypothetical protein
MLKKTGTIIVSASDEAAIITTLAAHHPLASRHCVRRPGLRFGLRATADAVARLIAEPHHNDLSRRGG